MNIASAVDALHDARFRARCDAAAAETERWGKAFDATHDDLIAASPDRLSELIMEADAFGLTYTLLAAVCAVDEANRNALPEPVRSAWWALHDAICAHGAGPRR